jgi:hypothetical protein
MTNKSNGENTRCVAHFKSLKNNLKAEVVQILRTKRPPLTVRGCKKQRLGTGSAWIRIYFGQLNPDPDKHGECGSGSGSRRAKMPTKIEKKGRNFQFCSAGCSLLRPEGFSSSLDVLQGGLGKSKNPGSGSGSASGSALA